jgi:hypothetical protein
MPRISLAIYAITSVFTISSICLAEQVVISEIMYNPPPGRPEYIEISNNTATPLDMACWQLTGGIEYTFPDFSMDDPRSCFLGPFERILVAGTDPQTIRAAYTIPSQVRVFGPWTGKLDNGGERITLLDKNGFVLCSVAYDDDDPWPVAPDGTGHSLVLVNPDRAIDDWRNWRASLRPGGSPGTAESDQGQVPIPNPGLDLGTGLVYIDYDSTWRYHDAGLDLGSAWKEPAFDDSTWPTGRGLFGFETAALPGPGIQTPLANHDQLTYYLRTSFQYNGPTSGTTIYIDQILDDGAVYYLNGIEIGRPGMPAGNIGFGTPAARTVGDAVEEISVITTDGSALRKGTNVLAVEVHQVGATSSDVVFGARLRISVPAGGDIRINEVMLDREGNGFVELYNSSSSPIDLHGYGLVLDPGRPVRLTISDNSPVEPGGLRAITITGAGLAITGPLTIQLIAPDGLTVVDAIRASIPLDGRSIGRQPDGSSNWYLFEQPTPGMMNLASTQLAQMVALNEVHLTGPIADWVELYNQSDQPAVLEGLYLCSRTDMQDRIPLSGLLPAKGLLTIPTNFRCMDDRLMLLLVSESGTVLAARRFTRPSWGDCLQAYPDGSGQWYYSDTSSPGLYNDPPRCTDVVINEIMYHPPSNEPSAEYIELYNRGQSLIDLSGWRFTEGIDFTIPQGTVIEPDGYLVVAADANWIRSVYGQIHVIGNFDGRLSNEGERVRLLDHRGNLVDEVDYRTGGNWPGLADGGGSSMELVNPWMDNSLPSAWEDSDESAKTEFSNYQYSDVFRQLRADGSATDYKELHLHLVGDSHVILKNIQLRENGTGPNLLTNTNKMSTDGRSSSGWLAQGNHYASFVDGDQLHLVADGHGDNRANRVEIDATAMQQGRTYQISFDARWVSGLSRLIVQTWDHSIATSISLPVPLNLGTPGKPNSCLNPFPAPQLDNLCHSPAVPQPGQPVKITVQVRSVDPNCTVILFHRLDNRDGNAAWASKPMADDGISGGDEVASDGIYTATLTEYKTAGQVVQFFVIGVAGTELTELPKGGTERPAMFVIDNPNPPGDLRMMRLVVSAFDLRDLSEGDAPTGSHSYAFPRLSNHYFNATLIVNEQDIYYNCGWRVTGSPWTRDGNRTRGKLHVPKDKPFRGKTKLSFDDIAGGQVAIHNDRLVRYWLYLLGHPVNQNEFVSLEINANGAALRDEVEPVANDFLDRIWPDGSQGELYRIDDEWWFQDSWARTYRNADWVYKGTDNPGRYRTEWMKRTRENEDDYSALISFFKKVSGTYTQQEIERLVDPAAITKLCAVRGYAGDWDWFSMNRGKNGYFYRRPTDGLFMFLHWDSDLAFQSGYINSAFYNGMAGFRPNLEKPYNMRLFKHYLTRIVEDYALNSARIEAWFEAEEQASTQYTVNTTLYRNWFTNRQDRAFSFLGTARTTSFAITTNSGKPMSTNQDSITLTGTAPLRVFKVAVEGQPKLQAIWDTDTTWRIDGIVLNGGENNITVLGMDEEGHVLHQASIKVTKTGNSPPVLVMNPRSGGWLGSVLEPMIVELLGSYDPDGSLLDYTWSVDPVAQLDASSLDIAYLYFNNPGIYTITVTAKDAAGLTTTLRRQAMIYATGDFDDFDTWRLARPWQPDCVRLRHNYCDGPYYSLSEVPGELILHVWDQAAYPLKSVPPAYPVVWRPLPATGDWAFACGLKIRGQVFGDYLSGIMIELNESGMPIRYALGLEDGSTLTAKTINSAGLVQNRASRSWDRSEVHLRIRKAADRLHFEYLSDGIWKQLGIIESPRSTSATAGLFLATDTNQTVKIGFDYAVLIAPGL